MKWPDLKFQPINLWSYPKMSVENARTRHISDTDRLIFIMEKGITIDAFMEYDMDQYEYALYTAKENGRTEPNEMDDIDGFRNMIDDAMEVFKDD